MTTTISFIERFNQLKTQIETLSNEATSFDKSNPEEAKKSKLTGTFEGESLEKIEKIRTDWEQINQTAKELDLNWTNEEVVKMLDESSAILLKLVALNRQLLI